MYLTTCVEWAADHFDNDNDREVYFTAMVEYINTEHIKATRYNTKKENNYKQFWSGFDSLT